MTLTYIFWSGNNFSELTDFCKIGNKTFCFFHQDELWIESGNEQIIVPINSFVLKTTEGHIFYLDKKYEKHLIM